MDWDDNTLSLKFDINLEKISAITLATRLWNNDCVQEEIKSFFGDWEKYDLFRSKEVTWRDITSRVRANANSLKLPQELLMKVDKFILVTGHQIHDWNKYVRDTLSLPFEFAYEVYWTYYGTVNESKIFQDFWVEKLGLKVSTDNSDNYIIFLSCLFGQVEFIRKNLEVIKNVTKLKIVPAKFKNFNYSESDIIAIWLCIYITQSKKVGIELYQKSHSKLLMMCIEQDLFEAAKYFWYNLSENEKLTFTAFKCGEKVLGNNMYPFSPFDVSYDHEMLKKTELLIFFINEMSIDERIEFVSNNLEAIFHLCNCGPFQEILVKMITDERMLNYIDSDAFSNLYSVTLNCLHKYYLSNRFVDNGFCRQILPKILERIPKETKLNEILDCSHKWFSEHRFPSLDVSTIRTILHDKDLADDKIKILEHNRQKFKQLIKSKKLEELNEFAVEVFPLENERKEFKLKMNFVSEFVYEGDIRLADELLNWIFDCDEERMKIKNQIDVISVFSSTTNIVVLNEFLLWRYDNEEERRKAKQIMRQNEFLAVKIIRMWNKNGEVDENECSEFLKWLIDENEAVQFKQLMRIDENFVRKFWESLYSLKYFNRTDALFKFFSLTLQEVRQIKDKLIENKNEWILTYVVTKKNFKLAEAIVNWIFRSEEQKEKVMKEYINSSNGALLLLKAFMCCSLNYGEAIVFLLNKWVKSYGNVHVIKDRLQSLVMNDFGEISGKLTVMALLDEIENRSEITTKTLSFYF